MSAGTKRLFIAVDIDEGTREQIGSISYALRASIGDGIKASWVRPERMHLTLGFFGTADVRQEQRITRALAEPIGERPFDLSFEGVGVFPERGAPRVLWLAVSRGAAELRRVHRMLHDRLEMPSERDKFSPHLTLARFKERIGRSRLEKTAWMGASAGPSRIDRVTLYQSRLAPDGPVYVRIAEAPLEP